MIYEVDTYEALHKLIANNKRVVLLRITRLERDLERARTKAVVEGEDVVKLLIDDATTVFNEYNNVFENLASTFYDTDVAYVRFHWPDSEEKEDCLVFIEAGTPLYMIADRLCNMYIEDQGFLRPRFIPFEELYKHPQRQYRLNLSKEGSYIVSSLQDLEDIKRAFERVVILVVSKFATAEYDLLVKLFSQWSSKYSSDNTAYIIYDHSEEFAWCDMHNHLTKFPYELFPEMPTLQYYEKSKLQFSVVGFKAITTYPEEDDGYVIPDTTTLNEIAKSAIAPVFRAEGDTSIMSTAPEDFQRRFMLRPKNAC